jgi:hypothetical protein
MSEFHESATIEGQYLEYLYHKIGSRTDNNPSHGHWLLAEQLYEKPFAWTVPNDDNREQDGLNIRTEFLASLHSPYLGLELQHMPCSMLEMILALAERASFMDLEGKDQFWWFWRIMDNLELLPYTDERYMDSPESHANVDYILESLIRRNYASNGAHGGMFPLAHPTKDQRKTEIWYQLSYYVMENNRLDE